MASSNAIVLQVSWLLLSFVAIKCFSLGLLFFLKRAKCEILSSGFQIDCFLKQVLLNFLRSW